MSKPGPRLLYMLFKKDSSGAVLFDSVWGQWERARGRERDLQGWGFVTSMVEIRNNAEYDVRIDGLRWS